MKAAKAIQVACEYLTRYSGQQQTNWKSQRQAHDLEKLYLREKES